MKAYLKRFYCRSENVITCITMSRSTQQNTWMQDEGVKHDTIYASNGNKNSNHRQGKAEELKAFLESTSISLTRGSSFVRLKRIKKSTLDSELVHQPFKLLCKLLCVKFSYLSIRHNSCSV